MYLLNEGQVRISPLSADGGSARMAILDNGDVFGELKAVDGAARSDFAEAIGDVLLCLWPRARFLEMIRANPEPQLQVTKSTGQRVRQLQIRVGDPVCRGTSERQQNLLQRLADDFGEPHPDGVRIGTSMTRDEPARLTGVSRQTVSENRSA